ncbi:MAG: hypothetical protein E6Q83_11920 [Thiothrix sp.]|nr:MAG: hypothetical protein E6Q83_11920 [Thiothrix sp.]
MKAWFSALSERERYLLIMGVTLILASVLWFYAWKPLVKYKAQVASDLLTAAEDATLLKTAKAQLEAEQLAATTRQPIDTTTSVQIVITPVLQKYQLARPEILVRSEAKGKEGVNIRLDNAPFDQVVAFLAELESQYAIYATSIALVPGAAPGLAGLQLTLER